MTFADIVGLAIAAFCAFELYRAVTKQETAIPTTPPLRVSRAEQPVLFRVALAVWFILLLMGLMLVEDII